MASASGIRAGQAYVEVGADDSVMMQRLAQSSARLKEWVVQNTGRARVDVAAVGGVRMDRFVGSAISVTAAMAGIAAVIRATDAGLKAHTGNWLGLHEALKAIPFRVGAAYSAFVELAGSITGATEAIAQLEKASAQQKRLEHGEKWLEGQELKLQFEIDQGSRSTVERDLASITKREIENLNKVHEAVRRGFPAEKVWRLNDLIRDRAELQRAAAQLKETARLEAPGREILSRLQEEHAKLTYSEGGLLERELLLKNATPEQGIEARRLADENARLKQIDQDITDMMAKAAGEAEEWYQSLERVAEAEADMVRDATALEESLRTPEETAQIQADRARELRDQGLISEDTFRRALERAVEPLADSAVQVAEQIMVRGMLGGVGAELMTAGGVDDRSTRAAEETARNVRRLVELAQTGRLVFNA